MLEGNTMRKSTALLRQPTRAQKPISDNRWLLLNRCIYLIIVNETTKISIYKGMSS